ncbi:uncharacterized protein H6S33_012123 [Morchella sextelata]|uniref:uncharacterized protein n=1 Tax=Morchella sextelata TaxID=1174677 RepID=UPI001D036F3F|nr:uncharacterized protein H6S33_012123 [Morchella sextelata]KAH0610596.1 hypothetical protein H6S33_012123 [Morchella sextelata]
MMLHSPRHPSPHGFSLHILCIIALRYFKSRLEDFSGPNLSSRPNTQKQRVDVKHTSSVIDPINTGFTAPTIGEYTSNQYTSHDGYLRTSVLDGASRSGPTKAAVTKLYRLEPNSNSG